MKTAKILNKPNLVRDLNTNAILNTNVIDVKRHEKRISDLQKDSLRELDIQQMKNDLSEIKKLLRQLSNSTNQFFE